MAGLGLGVGRIRVRVMVDLGAWRLHNRRLLVAVLVPRVRVSVKVVALHVGLIGNPKL